jgi:hypothetical protein
MMYIRAVSEEFVASILGVEDLFLPPDALSLNSDLIQWLLGHAVA